MKKPRLVVKHLPRITQLKKEAAQECKPGQSTSKTLLVNHCTTLLQKRNSDRKKGWQLEQKPNKPVCQLQWYSAASQILDRAATFNYMLRMFPHQSTGKSSFKKYWAKTWVSILISTITLLIMNFSILPNTPWEEGSFAHTSVRTLTSWCVLHIFS